MVGLLKDAKWLSLSEKVLQDEFGKNQVIWEFASIKKSFKFDFKRVCLGLRILRKIKIVKSTYNLLLLIYIFFKSKNIC